MKGQTFRDIKIKRGVCLLGLKIFDSISTINKYKLQQNIYYSNTNTFYVGNKFDTSVSLDKNGHNIVASTTIATKDNNRAKNVRTTAHVKWKWNMCNGNRILKTETLSFLTPKEIFNPYDGYIPEGYLANATN